MLQITVNIVNVQVLYVFFFTYLYVLVKIRQLFMNLQVDLKNVFNILNTVIEPRRQLYSVVIYNNKLCSYYYICW